MSDAAATAAPRAIDTPERSLWSDVWFQFRHHRGAMAGVVIFTLIVLVVVFGPLVQTLTFMFAVLIVLFNLIADVLYGILDPRIRYD